MPAYKQFMALGSDVLNEGGGVLSPLMRLVPRHILHLAHLTGY